MKDMGSINRSLTLRRAISHLLAVAMVASPLTAASQVPLERAAFTSYIAERLTSKVLEFAPVEVVTRPLAVGLRAPSGLDVEANLTQLHSHCIALEGRCAEATDEFVRAVLEVFDEKTRPIARVMLRPILRPAADVQSLIEVHRQRGMPRPIVRHYVGEIWIVLAIGDSALRVLATTDTLRRLGLDEPEAIELAVQNIRDVTPPVLERAVPLRGTYFELLAEDRYESTRLLLHDQWAEVAKQRGSLIVSVPASNSIIFGRGRNDEELRALRELATSKKRTALHPVSTQLLRWRPDGWELIEDKAEARAQTSSPTSNIRPDTPRVQ